MKRFTVILLSGFFLFSTSAFAQNFQIGLKAGANASNFTGSSSAQDLKTKSNLGFHVGGLMNVKFGETFSIQPELLVSSQGAKLENATQSENFKASYLSIPVMLKIAFSNPGLYLEAGPQLGFKIGNNLENTNTDLKSMDVALAAGIGYQTGSGFGVGARYLAGLSKVGDIDWGGSVNPDFKNSVIQVSLFFTFFNNK